MAARQALDAGFSKIDWEELKRVAAGCVEATARDQRHSASKCRDELPVHLREIGGRRSAVLPHLGNYTPSLKPFRIALESPVSRAAGFRLYNEWKFGLP